MICPRPPPRKPPSPPSLWSGHPEASCPRLTGIVFSKPVADLAPQCPPHHSICLWLVLPLPLARPFPATYSPSPSAHQRRRCSPQSPRHMRPRPLPPPQPPGIVWWAAARRRGGGGAAEPSAGGEDGRHQTQIAPRMTWMMTCRTVPGSGGVENGAAAGDPARPPPICSDLGPPLQPDLVCRRSVRFCLIKSKFLIPCSPRSRPSTAHTRMRANVRGARRSSPPDADPFAALPKSKFY
jgi:hypothetical protein